MKKADQFFLICGILGAPLFVFSTFLIGWFWVGYNPLVEGISILGGNGSPVQPLMNLLAFNLTGILTVFFAVGVWRSSEIGWLGKLASIGFFVAGVMMFLVGLFYGDIYDQDKTSFGSIWHTRVIYPQYTFLPIAFLFFGLNALRNRKLAWLFFAVILLGPLTLYWKYIFDGVWPPVLYCGLVQRGSIFLPYLIMALIAMGLYAAQGGRKKILLFGLAALLTLGGFLGMSYGALVGESAEPFICPRNFECAAYCQNNFGRCKSYCSKYTEHPLCQGRLSPE